MGYTKRDKARSVELGGALSPTQINRLTTTEGFGLPDGVAWPEFGSALARVTGKGRALDIAAVRLAAERGWYTGRLRRVLQDPMPEDRQTKIWDYVKGLAERGARAAVEAGTPEQAADLPETTDTQAEVMVETMFADMSDTWNGDSSADFEDGRRISATLSELLNGPPEPGREVYRDEFAEGMRAFANYLRSAPQWAKDAPDLELVQSVQIAAACREYTLLGKLGLGEEDTWRVVATIAPTASLWVGLANELRSQIGAP